MVQPTEKCYFIIISEVKMGITIFQWSKLIKLTMCISLLSNSCNCNQVPYKHLSLDENEILVDKIVSLETGSTEKDHKIVKIVTTDLEHDDKNKNTVSEVGKSDLELFLLIKEMQAEIKELKSSQELDRIKMAKLDSKLDSCQDETIISRAEVVQIRQLVSENFDKTALLEEVTQDNSVLLEGLKLFQKEAKRDLRRFKEYKEDRAAKRFHQLTNQVEKCEREIEKLQTDLNNLTQDLTSLHADKISLQDKQDGLKNDYNSLRNLTFDLQSDLSETIENLTSCCNTHIELANQMQQYSRTNQQTDILTNGNRVPYRPTNEIEIVEFGSGEIHDDYLSKFEEETNKVEGGKYSNNKEYGSGETIYEGSGDIGSGQTELPPFIDINNYVHINTFQAEKMKWEGNFLALSHQFDNLTSHISDIEKRVTSIQLGNFMQNLQESLINFTQNVITLDQWKLSSNQIVNSTLYNQDQIIKISNMVLDNTDKIADLRWKVSNDELLSDQQFNILRMYIIRLNNSVEDIKEKIKLLEKRNPSGSQTQYQASYYGYQTSYSSQTGYNTGDQTKGNSFGDQSRDSIEIMMSRLDDLGLQIVFNQNRLGNLEVKLLNESLYTCRKFNMDAYQDSQLASHEAIIKSNTNSIMLMHELVKELDYTVKSLNSEVKSNGRRIRTVNGNLDSLRGIVPVVIGLKKEIENFMFQLPTDCSEYYDRGYRKSGVYVIHPEGATISSQVTCHMTQDGGWTVIQQRFDGSVDFRRNWTDYVRGFGQVDSEYWIGNYLINLLTTNKNNSLQISMTDIDNNIWSANYDNFSVLLPNNKYTLYISGYSGNVTDAMSYSTNMGFSTRDRDNDASSTNCAFYYESGWWFKHCQMCNLNGRYNIGFMWFNQDTSGWIRLKSSVMKIKPS
ncbi:angiopoietin-2-like [Mercenaria mercenaria]|uniref:angiopoietin-2-like n=1 Tax=Mercenaria mercenaria TaxID=6596 RepID=UPI00234EE2FB|nr:angiopoietin-2-like [Mercenaria mercenaria]XP_053380479.1 angiopoietin-2-like [Mercenaria mercenaria]XP_053380480.1 angiopoietin-2-like [Mercenaria mercenaria]XP_053380481.1 angiopoietin-2-like [Mercenaria mercenaria]